MAALVITNAAQVASAQSSEPPSPTKANISYAPAEPAESQGHLLDLYLPKSAAKPVPILIYTGGSAWKRDNGKDKAGEIAAKLNAAGFAVAGVSIRSSAQTTFPGANFTISRPRSAGCARTRQATISTRSTSGSWAAAQAGGQR